MSSPPHLSALRSLATGVEAYLALYTVCCLVMAMMAAQAAITL